MPSRSKLPMSLWFDLPSLLPPLARTPASLSISLAFTANIPNLAHVIASPGVSRHAQKCSSAVALSVPQCSWLYWTREMYKHRLALGWMAYLMGQGWVNLLRMSWPAGLYRHNDSKVFRHTGCTGQNTQQFVTKALDELQKFCLSRNMSPLVSDFKQEHPLAP